MTEQTTSPPTNPYRARLEQEWRDSGTDLPFADWNRQRLTNEHAAELAEEQAAALRRRLSSLIPDRYVHATATDPAVIDWIEEFVHQHEQRAAQPVDDEPPWTPSGPRRVTPHGSSLLLLGPTGVGKTHEAFGTLRGVAEQVPMPAIRAVTAADLYARLRPRSGVDTETEFERYANAGLLLLDDLGAAKTSEWVEEINYRLVNHRYNEQLPTLITSNVAPSQLGAQLGERVASRLTEMCDRVVLKGADRRRAS